MSFQRSQPLEGAELVTGYHHMFLRVDTPAGKQWLYLSDGKWVSTDESTNRYCENEYGEFIATH